MAKKTVLLLLILPLVLIYSSLWSQPGGMPKKKVYMPGMMMNVNLLNAALYGPIVQLEAKLSGTAFLVPFLRYSYAGVASTYEWTNFEDDSQYDPSSVAGGIGYKKFRPLTKRKNFIYYGAFGEFIHEKGLHNMGSEYEYRQTRIAVAAYGNLGYRWDFKRGMNMSLGILPGFAFDIENEGLYNTGASEGLPFGDYKKNRFTGMIDFSLGWRLKR